MIGMEVRDVNGCQVFPGLFNRIDDAACILKSKLSIDENCVFVSSKLLWNSPKILPADAVNTLYWSFD
jgi:hypothetical protein